MSQNVNCKHHCESYFSVLGDVKESCFGMTTYLIFRWQCENCRLLHNFPLWWLNQLIHLVTNIGGCVCVCVCVCVRERERVREIIATILIWTFIKRHELEHIIECDLAWLINYLQNNVKRKLQKKVCKMKHPV